MNSERSYKELNMRTQAIVVARLHFNDGLSPEEVGKKLGISRRIFYRRLHYAREKGLLAVDKTPWRGLPELRQSYYLDQRLTQTYDSLISVVINLPDRLSMAAPLTEEETKLHGLLAFSAASHLRDTLRSGDCLGVGGGRTIGFLAKALTENRLGYKHVRVSSLVGGPPLLHRGHGGDEAVSADYVIPQIAGSFPDATVRYCYFSQFEGSDIRRRLPTMRPNVAIFGVGNVYPDIYHLVTDSGNPLTQPLRTRGTNLPEEIKLGIREVTSAVGQADSEEVNFYHPVGEVLGRLFLIPPPARLQPFIPEDSLERLATTIQAINKRVVAISDKNLLSAPVRILVAGGIHKVLAIRYLLESGFANRLITDRATAEWILGDSDLPKGEAVDDWPKEQPARKEGTVIAEVKRLRNEGYKNRSIAKILNKTYGSVAAATHQLIKKGEIEPHRPFRRSRIP